MIPLSHGCLPYIVSRRAYPFPKLHLVPLVPIADPLNLIAHANGGSSLMGGHALDGLLDVGPTKSDAALGIRIARAAGMEPRSTREDDRADEQAATAYRPAAATDSIWFSHVSTPIRASSRSPDISPSSAGDN